MLNPIFDIVSPLLDKILAFIPNPVEREKARAEQAAAILQALQQNDLAQLEVNKAEASSQSLFVAGWRPAVGWIGASGLGWSFILQPMLDWILAVCHSAVKTPTLDVSQLMTLMLGMLGMGALRSV